MTKIYSRVILEISYTAYLKSGYTPITMEDYFIKRPGLKAVIFTHGSFMRSNAWRFAGRIKIKRQSLKAAA